MHAAEARLEQVNSIFLQLGFLQDIIRHNLDVVKH